MTKVTLPPITFNQTFKTKKEARQEAIRSFMNLINDLDILSEIKVEVKAKCKRCPQNNCKNCPEKA